MKWAFVKAISKVIKKDSELTKLSVIIPHFGRLFRYLKYECLRSQFLLIDLSWIDIKSVCTNARVYMCINIELLFLYWIKCFIRGANKCQKTRKHQLETNENLSLVFKLVSGTYWLFSFVKFACYKIALWIEMTKQYQVKYVSLRAYDIYIYWIFLKKIVWVCESIWF